MIDLTPENKKFLPLKLQDGEEIFLVPPRKKLFAKLQSFRNDANEIGENDIDKFYDLLVDVTAAIMSENMQKKVFTPEQINDMLDIGDMSLITREYIKFTNGFTNNPN